MRGTPYAEVIRRVDLEDEPLDEVAARLGVTVNNATVRLHRARRRLRREIETACGPVSPGPHLACSDCACG